MKTTYNDKGEPRVHIENECIHPTYRSKNRLFILWYVIQWLAFINPFIKKHKHNMFKIMNTSHPFFILHMCLFLKAHFLPYKLVNDTLYMKFDVK